MTMFALFTGKGARMPKLKEKLPKNCNDRGRAFSWHNGKRVYHGVWKSAEAERNYKRFKAALLESPTPRFGDDGGDNVLVVELASGFLGHFESRIDKSAVDMFKQCIGYLVEIYGELAVNEFSPKKLKVVRDQMVNGGRLCRNQINRYTTMIIRIFSWGVEEELAKTNVQALREVKPLPKGEPGTFDHPPREDVPDDVVRQTLRYITSMTVKVMIMVQRLIGARPSEIFNMRAGDIDRTRGNGLWYYIPGSYKTGEFVGKIEFPLGIPEQKLLEPYLKGKSPDAAVFSPRTAMQERHAARQTNRKSKRTPSQKARDEARAENPAENLSEFYDRHSYGKAVKYAVEKGNREIRKEAEEKAGRELSEKELKQILIPHWTPYQLRNSAATEMELEKGLDESQALLAHKSANMTRRYSKAQLRIRENLARERVNPFSGELEQENKK